MRRPAPVSWSVPRSCQRVRGRMIPGPVSGGPGPVGAAVGAAFPQGRADRPNSDLTAACTGARRRGSGAPPAPQPPPPRRRVWRVARGTPRGEQPRTAPRAAPNPCGPRRGRPPDPRPGVDRSSPRRLGRRALGGHADLGAGEDLALLGPSQHGRRQDGAVRVDEPVAGGQVVARRGRDPERGWPVPVVTSHAVPSRTSATARLPPRGPRHEGAPAPGRRALLGLGRVSAASRARSCPCPARPAGRRPEQEPRAWPSS